MSVSEIAGGRRWLSVVLAALAAGAAAQGTASGVGTDSAAPAPTHEPTPGLMVRNRAAAALEDRIRLLSRELNLDIRQQSELRAIFERQRGSVRKIWTDSSLLPGERGPATRAISERTADEIRAILTEAQRKKYNPPKPPPAPRGSGSAEIQAWMSKMQAH